MLQDGPRAVDVIWVIGLPRTVWAQYRVIIDLKSRGGFKSAELKCSRLASEEVRKYENEDCSRNEDCKDNH